MFSLNYKYSKKLIKKYILVIILFSITVLSFMSEESNMTAFASATTVKSEKAVVTRIIDGDTVEVKLLGTNGTGNRIEKIRLIGINCPEDTTKKEPYGKEATAFTRSKLNGKTVYLQKDVSDRDRYGRLLRYVWLSQPTNDSESKIEKNMFNAILLVEGYSQVLTIQPDSLYSKIFIKLQATARKNNKGLWRKVNDGSLKGTSIIVESVNLKEETVIIINTSKVTQDMTNWKLISVVGNQIFTFPKGFKIKSGLRIKITSGPRATDDGKTTLMWTTDNIWNNSGDTAELYNGKTLVSRKQIIHN